MNHESPKLINGGVFTDERGELQFVNEFDMSIVKRMYFISHPSTETIRAWQGHTMEKRWFYCVKGNFIVKLVKIDNWEYPSDACQLFEYQLSEHNPQVLYIPNGYVNGFKANKVGSKLLIMSDYSLGEIKNDNYRFKSNKWTNW